ncbi:hypothetical protein FF1_027921 [Malus domestica]
MSTPEFFPQTHHEPERCLRVHSSSHSLWDRETNRLEMKFITLFFLRNIPAARDDNFAASNERLGSIQVGGSSRKVEGLAVQKLQES